MTGAMMAVACASTPLSATASPASVNDSCGYNPSLGQTNCAITTGSSTCTPFGGVGAKTFLWEWVSGDTFTVNSPNAATTTFSKTSSDAAYAGTYRCKVTDEAGMIAYSNNVEITSSHFDLES